MIEPIGLELGEARLGGAGSRDGDEKSLWLAEVRSVGLHEGAEASAQQISLVSFAGAATGDESGAQGLERWIGERAEDHEAAGFGLA